MQKIKDFIKKYRIKYPILSKETGYSRDYFSHLFVGYFSPSDAFMLNLIHAIHRIVSTQQKEFEKIIKETQWKDILY